MKTDALYSRDSSVNDCTKENIHLFYRAWPNFMIEGVYIDSNCYLRNKNMPYNLQYRVNLNTNYFRMLTHVCK